MLISFFRELCERGCRGAFDGCKETMGGYLPGKSPDGEQEARNVVIPRIQVRVILPDVAEAVFLTLRPTPIKKESLKILIHGQDSEGGCAGSYSEGCKNTLAEFIVMKTKIMREIITDIKKM